MTLNARITAARLRRNSARIAGKFAVRSGKGLGDSLYLQSVVRHLVENGRDNIEVCTSWPDVFRPLNGKVHVSPFRRDCVDASFHYISRKRISETDQFTDCCIAAGIKEKIDLRLDWTPVNRRLLDNMRNVGKPIVLVQLPRDPMGRPDGFGNDLLPNCKTIQKAIDKLGERAFTVQVGAGKPLHRFRNIGLDLANRTSVSDLLDVASISSGALGYCSFIVPLAESLNKPVLLVWSRQGTQSRNDFIRAITPQKIFFRSSSTYVMDDCTLPELDEAVDAFCHQIGSGETVRGQDSCDSREWSGSSNECSGDRGLASNHSEGQQLQTLAICGVSD